MDPTAEHPNAARLRRYFQAFAAGDIVTTSSLLAEDVEYHVGCRTSVSGTYRGKDEVFRYYGALSGLVTSTSLEIESVLADDTTGLVLAAVEHHRHHAVYSGRTAMVYGFEEGLITEIWEMPFDPYSIDAFFG